MHFAFIRIHFQQWPNMSTESYLNIYRIYVYRIYSQIIDKWGVAQSAGQDTSGMWIKYGTSDSTCADHIRQPNYNLGK